MINVNRKIWIPIVVWVSLFLVTFNFSNHFLSTPHAFLNAANSTFGNCAIYYITTLFLFPRFYKKGRGYFLISSLVFVVIASIVILFDIHFLSQFRGDMPKQEPLGFHLMRYSFNFVLVFFVATSVSLIEHNSKLKEAEKVLSKEKLETELKLLKAQINPHFIFNALNNIYSLTYIQSKNAPESILKLSEMLRYVFYDCSKDRVPLSAELNYIDNFTAFQQMKSDFTQNISLKTDINRGSIEIAPMLFIPFIENAFKYSRIEENEEARVNINIKLKEHKLFFKIENSIAKNKPTPGSGMGIKNVKHRLDIIYPEEYELQIDDGKDLFKVNLSLDV